MIQSTHPVQLVTNAFKQCFLKQYQKYVKKTSAGSKQELVDTIEKKTVHLQTDYVLKMASEY